MDGFNSTNSAYGGEYGEERLVVQGIKFINASPIFWMKVIPDFLLFIGLFANALLAIYLIKYKRYRSPIFILIFSMCFVDAIMCAISIVWTTFRVPYLTGPAWLCPFTVEILYASIINSAYHLVVMSVVRFYQLVFPLAARVKVTSLFMAKICIAVWIFSYITSMPFAILNVSGPWYEYDGEPYRSCIFIGPPAMWGNLYNTVVNLLAPFTITAAFHIAKHCIVLKAGAMSANSKEEQKRETTDTRAVMMVITAYLVTATPITVQLILSIIGVRYPPQYAPLIGSIITNAQFLNSVFNPFIYAFAAQSVRHDIRRMLQCNATHSK